jgi:seryl-tRNA synthetase
MTFWGWFTGADRYNNIDRKLNTIMADLTALQAAANQITTDVSEAVARLNELGDLLAAGELTQADLDAVTATLTSASTALDDAVAADVDETPGDPAPVDPEPTEPTPVDPGTEPTEV